MDETQPLLHGAIDNSAIEKDVVDFNATGDPENPRDWPTTYKWAIVALLALTAFTVTFTCISVVPIASRITYELSNGDAKSSASVLLVTIWEFGEAAGPLVIAPLSEVFGRYPVINVTNGLFISAIVLAALCQSTPLFIAARALTGLAVASNVLNPAIVGDMFIPEQQGSAMSIIMLAPLIGGAIGPAISGAVAQSSGWRWVLWMSAILAGACELVFLTSFRETYKVTILQRKAARLRKETGDTTLRTAFETDEALKSRSFLNSIMRPVVVFSSSGVLQVMSLFGSVYFTFYYIMSTTLPDILEQIYGMSPALTGSAFIIFSIGSTISVIICNLLLDKIYIKLRDSHKGIEQPEYRLPLVIVGAFTLPLIVISYGWIVELRLPLPLLLLSVGLLGLTLLLSTLPLMAFVVDAFRLYSASAMTAVIVSRCLMSTFLPLVTKPVIEEIGHGWAFTLLGALSLCLAPIPALIFRYGHKWRQRSEYTKEE